MFTLVQASDGACIAESVFCCFVQRLLSSRSMTIFTIPNQTQPPIHHYHQSTTTTTTTTPTCRANLPPHPRPRQHPAARSPSPGPSSSRPTAITACPAHHRAGPTLLFTSTRCQTGLIRTRRFRAMPPNGIPRGRERGPRMFMLHAPPVASADMLPRIFFANPVSLSVQKTRPSSRLHTTPTPSRTKQRVSTLSSACP